MMHKAWSSIEEVPYCFSRSSIKFQGHIALEIVEFDSNWAFLDCNSSLNSTMAMKCCTKLETAKKRCPIVFQGHPSNFKVTRDKTSPILTQIGRFGLQAGRSFQIPQICLVFTWEALRQLTIVDRGIIFLAFRNRSKIKPWPYFIRYTWYTLGISVSRCYLWRYNWTQFVYNTTMIALATLQWRHNGRDSVSNHQPHDCLLDRLSRRRSKKTSKLRVTGLCAGNSPGTGEFPAQMASNAENVSIWWRHHGDADQPSWKAAHTQSPRSRNGDYFLWVIWGKR